MGLRVVLEVCDAVCVSCKRREPLTVNGVHVSTGDVDARAPATWFRYRWDEYGGNNDDGMAFPPMRTRQLYICPACVQLAELEAPRGRVVQRDPT